MKFKRIISIVLAIMLVVSTALSVSPAHEVHASGNCPNCWGSFYNNSVSDHLVDVVLVNPVTVCGGNPRLEQSDLYYIYQPICNTCGRACGSPYWVYIKYVQYYVYD